MKTADKGKQMMSAEFSKHGLTENHPEEEEFC